MKRRKESNSLSKYMEGLNNDNYDAEEEIYKALYLASQSIKKFAADYNANAILAAEKRLVKNAESDEQEVVRTLTSLISKLANPDYEGGQSEETAIEDWIQRPSSEAGDIMRAIDQAIAAGENWNNLRNELITLAEKELSTNEVKYIKNTFIKNLV